MMFRTPPKLICTIGVSGAGKSTWAREYIKQQRDTVRVNRDDIRRCMKGELTMDYYNQPNLRELEDTVTIIQNEQIRIWLQKGYSVILDNTTLGEKYVDEIKRNFQHLADIAFKFFDIDTSIAMDRIRQRDGIETPAYINNQMNAYEKMKAKYKGDFRLKKLTYDSDFNKHWYEEVIFGLATKKCYLVDIDGTCADSKGVRNVYDGDSLYLDHPILPVRELLRSVTGNRLMRFFGTPKIIYVSGREGKWKDETVKWLKDNDFPYHGEIYMRKTGDFRNDAIVKEEIYDKYIADKYFVLGVFDDRLQVLHNTWYKRNVFAFCVNQGLHIF